MADQWLFSTVHNCACKVIEEQTLWGQTACRVWLPNQDAVVRLPRSALLPLGADLRPEIEGHRIAYVAAAAKVVHSASRSDAKGRLLRKGSQINEAFARWLDGHYASLVNVPPSSPAMVHHVARHIARELEKSKQARAALVVMDGLALDQWITVRHVLEERDRSLLIHESAIFAWVPTLTSISRQAIFAGRPPLYFPTSIYSTNAEGNLWRKLWEPFCPRGRNSRSFP